MSTIRKQGRAIPVFILILSGLLLIGGVSASEFGPWSIQTVDSGKNVGQYSSVALDAAGNPAISYYDQTYGDLKYASWNGSTWVITTVDCSRVEGKNKWAFWDRSYDRTEDREYITCFHGTEKVGKYSSLAFDSSDKPRISFFDASQDDLKYASWSGSTWVITTVDRAGNVGEFSSLALDSTGMPRISYYDKTNTNLKYASWSGSTWVITTVDGTRSKADQKKFWDGDLRKADDRSKKVGKYSSLALDSTGMPRISYYDESNKDLKYAAFNGSTWVITTVDSSKRVGEYASLELDANGDPRISYYDATNRNLKFAAWNRTTSRWVTEIVDSSRKVGAYSSLALDPLGAPCISYYDQSNKDLKYAAGNGQAETPTAPTVTGITPDSGIAGTLVPVTSLAGTNFIAGTTPAVTLTKTGEADITATNVTVVSPTLITCTFSLPSLSTSPGMWDLVVRNEDGQSGSMTSAFTVLAGAADAPAVTGITPATGVAGTSVTITDLAGTGFITGATVNLTKSGSADIIATSVTVDSLTKITCTLPLPAPSATSAGQWNVVVTNPDGQSSTLANAFTVTNLAPTVTAISPVKGVAGSAVSGVTITGTNFIAGTTPSVSLVKSGQDAIVAADVVVVSPTQITCTLPTLPSLSASAGQWDVVVTNTDTQSGTLSGGFTIEYPSPSVISVIPSDGPAGTIVSVNITGTNFNYGPNPSIWLAKTGASNISATDVHVYGQTEMSCTFNIPASSSVGEWNIMVMNLDGNSASKIGAFTITEAVVPSQTWDWSTANGWDGWQYTTTCTEAGTGPCTEYGPAIENGYGIYGSSLTPDSGSSTESRVWKTFTAPPGTQYSTLTFTGLLSSSAADYTRSMTIYVNNEMVFSGDASQSPPGNGQQFTITKSFTPANEVIVKISAKQDPIFETDPTLYTLQFNSLTLGS